MQGPFTVRVRTIFVALMLACLCWTSLAHAYIDLAPTLARIIADSKKITLVEVVEWNKDTHVLVLKEIRALKGESSTDTIRHELAPTASLVVPRQIRVWATPGARCIVFSSRNTALVCVGQGWYQAQAAGTGVWKLAKDRPDLPLAYFGNVSRLADSISLMLAGKEAVLTVVAHGADDEAASFDLALNRHSLPGMARVQRIRANLNMPAMVMAASANPAYLIGSGAVDEADVPALIKKLESSDAMERAEAAEDLRTLGRKARPASAPLEKLLADSSHRVRVAAASALLLLNPKDADSLSVLKKALDASEATTRRDALRAIAFAGPGASPLAEKIAALLTDKDEAVRLAALQAISVLGPAAARTERAVTLLLDDANLAIDAADALGRIGPSAKAALPRLTKMLSAKDAPTRWAGVRAMSQIGGPDAHPAVEFMIKTFKNANEIEGYNMMIYLALLGPVAEDALPTIRSTRIKNPILPSATTWAIAPDKSFPWMGGLGRFGMGGPGGPGGRGRAEGPGGPDGPGGRGPDGPEGFAGRGGPEGRGGRSGPGGFAGPGGFGGPGRGPGGPGGPPDIGTLIYESYIHELGGRLRPATIALAKKIIEGKAGNVPAWGYKILTCAPDEAVALLTPHLTDKELLMRERAVVALGYMGPAGAAGADKVKAALARAENEREKKLIAWCLREITRD
jgi:HEAT repeat protein